jgi:hypothetical protein
MTTGYTREELHTLRQMIEQHLPPEMGRSDKKAAERVTGVGVAGMDLGVLLRLGLKKTQKFVFLNCALVLELVVGIYAAGQLAGWWNFETKAREQYRLAPPADGDAADSFKPLSIRTLSDYDGLLVALADETKTVRFFLSKEVATETLSTIQAGADRLRYWDGKMDLIPARAERLQ